MKTDEAGWSLNGTAEQGGIQMPSALLKNPPLLFAVDVLIGALAYSAAWLVRIYVPLPFTQDLLPQERWDAVNHFWILLLVSQGFFLYILGTYDDLRVLRYRELMTHVFSACLIQVVAVTSIFYLTNGIFPRSVILVFGVLNFLSLLAWRSYVKSTVHGGVQRVLIVGESLESASEIVKEIEKAPWMGLHIVGLAVDSGSASTDQNPSSPVLGNLSQTQEIINRYRVDVIIFASQQSWRDEVLNAVSQLQAEKPLRIAILPSVYEIAIGRLRHINIHDTPLIEVRRNPNEPLARLIKRSFDLVVSVLGLILLAPFVLIIAAAIALTSPGPVLYRQKRVGLGGRVFWLFKFRTMVQNAEAVSEERLADKDDPRITRIGTILRRFRFDEIPQFVNVLKGDMSFVGPRPERPKFVKTYSRKLSGYSERHKVKPGMTGLAQVRGYYRTGAENKLKYDLAYIYNYSFSLDLLILLETIKVILVRRGS